MKEPRCVISGERDPRGRGFRRRPVAIRGSRIRDSSAILLIGEGTAIRRKCEFRPVEITVSGRKRRFAIQEPDRDAEDARVARVAKDRNFNSRQADAPSSAKCSLAAVSVPMNLAPPVEKRA